MLKPGDILEARPDHHFCHSRGRFWMFIGASGRDEWGKEGYSLKNLSDGKEYTGFYMEETLLSKNFFTVHSVDLENK